MSEDRTAIRAAAPILLGAALGRRVIEPAAAGSGVRAGRCGRRDAHSGFVIARHAQRFIGGQFVTQQRLNHL